MKIILETVYSNVDDEWLEWYLRRLESGPLFNKEIAQKLRECGFASVSTKDEKVTHTTNYRIEK